MAPTGHPPTSHRAAGPALRPRAWWVAVPVTVLVIGLAAWWGVDHLGESHRSPAGAQTTPGSARPTPSTTPSPTSTPTATASRTVSAPSGPRLPKVAAAPPQRLVVAGLVDAAFGNAVNPTDGRLIPTGHDLLQREATRALPGNPATDTVVIVGAALSDGTGPFASMDKAGRGADIDLTTDAGTLRYRIESVTSHPPGDVLGLRDVQDHTPGLLVLDVAHYSGGNRQGDDLVVVAELTKASPA